MQQTYRMHAVLVLWKQHTQFVFMYLKQDAHAAVLWKLITYPGNLILWLVLRITDIMRLTGRTPWPGIKAATQLKYRNVLQICI